MRLFLLKANKMRILGGSRFGPGPGPDPGPARAWAICLTEANRYQQQNMFARALVENLKFLEPLEPLGVELKDMLELEITEITVLGTKWVTVARYEPILGHNSSYSLPGSF